MRAIKGIVIGMGLLIVVGFIVIAVTLVMRAQGLSEPKQAYRSTVSIPAGTAVETTETDGDRILLRLAGTDGSAWLMVIDAHTGVEQGRIKLLPEAP